MMWASCLMSADHSSERLPGKGLDIWTAIVSLQSTVSSDNRHFIQTNDPEQSQVNGAQPPSPPLFSSLLLSL